MTVNPFRDPPQRPRPIQYNHGDRVTFFGEIYVVGLTLNISIPPYPGFRTGLCYAIRKPEWFLNQYLIVSADEVEEPVQVAC